MSSPDTEDRVGRQRSVQDYIDERPTWSDGTYIKSTPMTGMQWRIWGLACAGKFFEGMVVFMTGVALPLISIEFGLVAADKGLVTAASLAGILVGASALGGMADHFGRKRMFIIEMIIFTGFLIALTFSPNFITLVICLFGAGVALGCDYPTAHMVISESIPTSMRGRLVLSAFAFQAIGALTGTIVGFFILFENPDITAWRWMYASAIVPAILVIVGRLYIIESPHWLMHKGRTKEAEQATLRLLRRSPAYPTDVSLGHLMHKAATSASSYAALFNKKNRRATILASVPWFLQDLGTYGIGIFTPTILAAVIGKKSSGEGLADTIHNDILGIKGSALMDVLFVFGILFAIVLVDRVGRIKLQTIGFIGCAVGLLLAALSIRPGGDHVMVLLFAGFMLFYFMTNLGPNSMTYLLAGEVFPTEVRGRGAGFAASFAKVGAVLTAFLFPILLKEIGTSALLYLLVIAFIVGAVVTVLFRIETTGVSLENVGKEPTDPDHAPVARQNDLATTP
ncbi:MFS transporter [Mycobacterium sp. CVI_P3]|uniref:MFS transporter n=1 Tax=Mycobacterium pinniadriaticum TaxID=2994102 RepID=A0ABT3SLS4_9MYCO|nr:MFS transporter [Mycobacterium pinniadriaticum]MCX2934030.1 MFS transporter [Mycobacterium pinniadriaticum]MCX2940473.1 MFS transporter [Mycobacterium pinniadriaticum]